MTDDLRKLAEAATPNWDDVSADVWGGCGSGEFEIASNEPNEPIAAYIAAANPARVLALLDELERLREELDACEGYLDRKDDE